MNTCILYNVQLQDIDLEQSFRKTTHSTFLWFFHIVFECCFWTLWNFSFKFIKGMVKNESCPIQSNIKFASKFVIVLKASSNARIHIRVSIYLK